MIQFTLLEEYSDINLETNLMLDVNGDTVSMANYAGCKVIGEDVR